MVKSNSSKAKPIKAKAKVATKKVVTTKPAKSVPPKSKKLPVKALKASTEKVPADLIKILKPIMLHQSIEEWALKSNTAFDNKTPVEIWKTQPQRIIQMVNFIIHGK